MNEEKFIEEKAEEWINNTADEILQDVIKNRFDDKRKDVVHYAARDGLQKGLLEGIQKGRELERERIEKVIKEMDNILEWYLKRNLLPYDWNDYFNPLLVKLKEGK